jgi:hypothetical protein
MSSPIERYIEKYTIIDPELTRVHFGLLPKLDQTRQVVAELAKELYRKKGPVRPPVDPSVAPASRITRLLNRLGEEHWVGDGEAIDGPLISTFGNGSKRLIDLRKLGMNVTLASHAKLSPAELRVQIARRAVATLAEASRVAYVYRKQRVRSDVRALLPETQQWLAIDPENAAAYDDTLSLWQQPFQGPIIDYPPKKLPDECADGRAD